MMSLHPRPVPCLVLLAALSAGQASVQAQPAAAAAAPSAPASSPQAVVITGQKIRRAEQDTYTSTGVVTGQQAEDLGLRDLRDALRLQGNVYVAPSNNGNNGISIRGINSEGVGEPGANMRPLTTLVIDGAAQSFEGVRRGQRGTWDIAQIEVARGPQSTLQGRNALAGALTLRTNDPTDHWEAGARLLLGEADVFGPALMLSGPLLERELALRISAETARGHKGIRYTDPGLNALDDDEYRNLRAKLRWRPAGWRALEAKLTVSDTLDDPAVAAVTAPYADRVFDRSQSAVESRRNRVRNTVLDLAWTLRPGVTLSSTTAHVQTHAGIAGRGTLGGLAYARDETRVDNDTTEELRLTWQPPGSAVEGVLGLFLGRFGNARDSLVTTNGAAFQDIVSQRRDRSTALFTEWRWAFRPGWNLTAGTRLDHERSRLVEDNQLLGTVSSSAFSHHAHLPKLGLAHQFSPGRSVALTWSTGYRAGFHEQGRDIKPEFLRSWDLAWRSTLGDPRLTLNANLFHYRWRDQQLTVLDGLDSYTENAGRSQVRGAELALAWRAGRRLDAGLSLGYTRTRFDEARLSRTGTDYTGKQFPEAPRWSGGAWVSTRLGDGWFVSADLSARGKAFATSDLDNTLATQVPGRAVVGLRLGWEGALLSTVLQVDNLLDKHYLTGRDIRGGAYVGDPRRVGVSMTVRY